MLNLKNNELQPVTGFLQSLKLKNKSSRARTRLVGKLDAKVNELVADQKMLLEKYGQHDASGNLIRDGNDNFLWQPEFAEEATSENEELLEEKVTIDLSEYQSQMQVLTAALDELDAELSDVDANIYAVLMDVLEEETKEEN